MNIDHYRRQAAAVLDAHRAQIKDRLAVCFLNIPASATSATVGIHVDAEGEGFLTLRLHLEGPGLYVLNRALGDHAELFSTTMSEDGLQPALPLMRPGHESFQVSDALSDCALAWLRTQWAELAPADIAIPVQAEAMEDHGDRESVILQR